MEGRPYYVIEDPLTGFFFRVREVEHFIARQLNGATSLDVIRERVQKKFEAPLDPATLADFVDALRRYNLLEGTGGERGTQADQEAPARTI
ncbi:MAG: hypothetical protein DMG07_24035 [Acidobacteria bacterium]|nr:MAG: hypothetical protein DMG07_24035 [Acidobacteriota bacterium]